MPNVFCLAFATLKASPIAKIPTARVYPTAAEKTLHGVVPLINIENLCYRMILRVVFRETGGLFCIVPFSKTRVSPLKSKS